ncbi:hypothetical protein [Streptomyces olivochromogenes]|uniref:hypothetical protein n=1 Tax=Streptomyces olivochromogenes TaxID=1963 RepID=UPI001F3ED9CA|nr:hypothetical protein [Streptomyces olivochromogenes]MCF3132240.1 hypothetical protein [Streptomyces olivochromogenes]
MYDTAVGDLETVDQPGVARTCPSSRAPDRTPMLMLPASRWQSGSTDGLSVGRGDPDYIAEQAEDFERRWTALTRYHAAA